MTDLTISSENVDDVNLSDREIELEATLVHEIEIESRDEP